MTETKKALTWMERVLAYLEGGDAAKLARAEKYCIMHCKDQIDLRDREISKLNDKIEIANEKLEESKVNVNLDKLNTTDDYEEFAVDFIDHINSIRVEIATLEDKRDDTKEALESFKLNLKEIWGK